MATEDRFWPDQVSVFSNAFGSKVKQRSQPGHVATVNAVVRARRLTQRLSTDNNVDVDPDRSLRKLDLSSPIPRIQIPADRKQRLDEWCGISLLGETSEFDNHD